MDVAFLGDSLTEGWPGAAYFPLLQSRLGQHRLLNHGRAGDTVAGLRTRMLQTGLSCVDAAFVWIGANDAVLSAWDASDAGNGWGWPERLARIREDYEKLAEWTGARTQRLVLVKPIILEADGSLWEARAVELGAMVEDIGAARGIEVLDLAPSFAAARAAGNGPFTIDGVHFTDAGARVVAAAFAAVVTRVV